MAREYRDGIPHYPDDLATDGMGTRVVDVQWYEREIAQLQSKLSIAEGALMIQDKCAAGYHQQIDELQGKLAETGRERDHWKANHDTQVRRTGLLAERHDLPVDRLPAYREMERLQSKLAEAEKEINGWKIIAHERLIRAIDGDQRIASLEVELKTERENGAKLRTEAKRYSDVPTDDIGYLAGYAAARADELADAKRYRKIRRHRPQWYCSFITDGGYRCFHGKELDEQVDAIGDSHADE